MKDKEVLEQSYKNPSKFTEIFNRYNKLFLRRARLYIRSKDQAEDAVQNTFVKIYKYGKKFVESDGDFKSWSYTILQNCINDELRKQITNPAPISSELASVLVAPDNFESRIDSNYLHSLINKLENDSAQILKLHYIQGKPQREIAKILGISDIAVRVRIFRAKQACINLHKKLNK